LLERRRNTQGRDDPGTISTMYVLGFLVDGSELYDLEKQMIEVREKAAKAADATVGAQLSYAFALIFTPVTALRNPTVALEFVQKAIAKSEQTNRFGSYLLGKAYRMTGNLDAAIATYEEVRGSFSDGESGLSRDVEIALINSYRQKQDNAAADEILNGMMARLKNRDPVYLQIMQHMTDIALLLEGWNDQRWPGAQLSSGFRTGNWPLTIAGNDDLGEGRAWKYIQQKRYDRAEQILKQVLKIRKLALPDGHWRIGNSSILLAQSLVGQSKFDEAEPYFTEGYAIVTNAEDMPEHIREMGREPMVQTGITLYEGLNQPQKAEEYRSMLNEG